jgi:hypothetical protein
MKKLMVVSLIWLASLSTPANAADFDWTVAFNAKYQLASDQFFDRMAVRFSMSNYGISAVVSASKDYADAYIIFRLAEISEKPVDRVMDLYQGRKGNGWGVLAKQLGIKPGSDAFKALKAGHDLDMPKKQDTKASVTININATVGAGSKKDK